MPGANNSEYGALYQIACWSAELAEEASPGSSVNVGYTTEDALVSIIACNLRATVNGLGSACDFGWVDTDGAWLAILFYSSQLAGLTGAASNAGATNTIEGKLWGTLCNLRQVAINTGTPAEGLAATTYLDVLNAIGCAMKQIADNGFTPPFPAEFLHYIASSESAVGNGNPTLGWTDQSGNGFDSTVLSAEGPLYIANGIDGKPSLRFTTNRFATGAGCQISAANAHTGFVVLKLNSFTPGGAGNIFSFQSNNFFMLWAFSSGKPQIVFVQTSFANPGFVTIEVGQAVVISWQSTPTEMIVRVNGMQLAPSISASTLGNQISGPASELGAAAINTVNIGSNQFTQVIAADYSEVLVYDEAIGMAKTKQKELQLAATYGITIVEDAARQRRFTQLGDSRSAISNPGQTSPSDTLDSLRNVQGYAWLGLGAGVSGNTTQQMAARVPADVIPNFSGSLTKNVVVIWGGINNIFNGDTAAVTYAGLTSCVSQCNAAGFQTLICTEIDAPGLDAAQQIVRTALNVLISANTAGATAVCGLNAAMGTSGANPTRWQDNVHPSPEGGIVLADAIGASIALLP